ncbi:MAG: glycosyltransferase [Thermomicrobiales bacterium]
MTRTILFVHPSDELYGSDRCLLDIIQGLPATDRAILVLPTDLDYGGDLSRAAESAGAAVARVDMLVLRRSALRPGQFPALVSRLIAGTLAIARLIRRFDVDLVHSNTVAVTCGASAALMTGKPHVWHVHEHIGDEPAPFRLLIRLMLGLFPGRIIANSRPVARALIGGSRRLLGRTRVVENSVDPGIEPSIEPTRVRPGRYRRRCGCLREKASRKRSKLPDCWPGALGVLRDAVHHDVPPGRNDLWETTGNSGRARLLASHVTFAGQVDDVQRARSVGYPAAAIPASRTLRPRGDRKQWRQGCRLS